jgi:hypothetical protein
VKQFFKDLVTGIDGESYDIARVIIAMMTVALIPILFIGVGFYLYGYIVAKPFDIQGFFTAILTFIGGVGTLLTTGAAAIYFKKTTEPNGTETTVESITKGRQPDTIKETIVAGPAATIMRE